MREFLSQEFSCCRFIQPKSYVLWMSGLSPAVNMEENRGTRLMFAVIVYWLTDFRRLMFHVSDIHLSIQSFVWTFIYWNQTISKCLSFWIIYSCNSTASWTFSQFSERYSAEMRWLFQNPVLFLDVSLWKPLPFQNSVIYWNQISISMLNHNLKSPSSLISILQKSNCTLNIKTSKAICHLHMGF
jgi:hypothetical protein